TLSVGALSDGGSIAVSARQTDAAGNLGSASATTRKDATAPTVVFSSPVAEPTRISSIPVTVTFSEAVSGFDVQRLVVTNATVSAFTLVSGTVYTFILTPVSNGVVTVALADGAVLDAAGNGNTTVPQFRRTYAPRTQVYLPLLRR
ncbi:MAG: Ig-like domain-containing protein, partial [Chloroflexales bacterium]